MFISAIKSYQVVLKLPLPGEMDLSSTISRSYREPYFSLTVNKWAGHVNFSTITTPAYPGRI
jgi:hypothetical protein